MIEQAMVEEPIQAYLTGQIRPHHPELIAAFERESAAVLARLPGERDVAYGPHPRQRLDLFVGRPQAPLVAYFHAGYWQSRDKSQFRFLADPLLAAGFSAAFVNYPLCPDVTVAGLVAAARAAVPALLAMPGAPVSLIAAGHSAGGHIAVELAATDWRAHGLERSPIAGVFALSGVYDLEPLLDTPLNDKLRLDEAAARAASPLHRLPAGLPPAVFAVGGDETGAFLEQNRRMHEAWRAAGGDSRLVVEPGADHMTLLRRLADPDSLLREGLRALGGAASA